MWTKCMLAFACPCLLGLFWWSDVEDVLLNHRNITLMEQAKWALFLKSFFEISEAIPWPRDHILFTFSLPTTQATLAKFTKEDPHWKIRLIPDWKFMCWLRWISSGRFSQESGVKRKKKKATKLGSILVKKWSQCQASKAHVRLSRAAFHAQGLSGFPLLDLKGEVMSSSLEGLV